MRKILEDITPKLAWVERLDLFNDLAPLAPELVIQMEQHEQQRANTFKGNHKIPYVAPDVDPVLNDFKREMTFYRQAQAAAIEGIKKMQEQNIAIKRPDDYFAEMAKSDDHMQKVRARLLAKQEGHAKSERVKRLRQQRILGKTLQKQAKVNKVNEKKDMIDKLKKFRKGKLQNLDFLNENKTKNFKSNDRKAGGKNAKYRKGGKGGKGGAPGDRSAGGGKGGKGGAPGGRGGGGDKGGSKPPQKRMGKNRRVQAKGKNKRK